MTRCGVDLLGLDQVDARRPALRARWCGAGLPTSRAARPGCAAQRARALVLAALQAAAAGGVPDRRRALAGAAAGGSVLATRRALCRRARMRWAVPRTGHEAQTLRRGDGAGRRRAGLAAGTAVG